MNGDGIPIPKNTPVPRSTKLLVVVVILVAITAPAAVWAALSSSSGAASSSDVSHTLHAQEQESARRDCVTTLSTARRAVFDDVDLYKAELVSGAAYQTLNGAQLPQATRDYLKGEAVKLSIALIEARRLQPPKMLDGLIAHGGLIAGVHYDACPR